jgi:hypothetical protein
VDQQTKDFDKTAFINDLSPKVNGIERETYFLNDSPVVQHVPVKDFEIIVNSLNQNFERNLVEPSSQSHDQANDFQDSARLEMVPRELIKVWRNNVAKMSMSN